MRNLRRPSLRIPNTRTAALLVALGLAALGFAVGLGLLVLAPMMQAGSGPFAVLGGGGNAGARLLAQPRALPTPVDPRPELWWTPVASLAFPSVADFSQLAQAAGAVSASYEPRRRQFVLAPRPLVDASGKAAAVVLIGLSSDEDPRTPEPVGPDPAEPTQLTIAVSPVDSAEVPACVFAIRGQDIEATAAVEPATSAECRAGSIRLADGRSVSFAFEYEVLPNYRSRDGAWREGGVFGRTTVWLALRDAEAG